MERYTNQQIWQAGQANLADFCQSIGIQIAKSGKDNGNIEYQIIDESRAGERKSNGRSQKFTSCNINGCVYYRFSSGDSGNAVDFCMKELNMTEEEVVRTLLQFQGLPTDMKTVPFWVSREPVCISGSERTDFKPRLSFVENPERVFAYLCKTRKIDYEIVQMLISEGLLKQDTRGNVCFCRYGMNHQIVGIEKHGTSTVTRFQQTDGAKGFCLKTGEPENICVFESAIDLLSFAEIYSDKLNNHLLVSMGGLNSIALELRQAFPEAKVFLCVDNDDAGNNFIWRTQREGRFFRYQTANCKDWNDLLKQKKLR